MTVKQYECVVITCVSPVCYLYRVRVRSLAQDLQQGGIGHEEESRKHQALLLQVT